jgi:hypothetical protein
MLVLWFVGRGQILEKRLSPPRRSFDQMLFLAFLSTLPWSFVEFATAAAPSIGGALGTPFAFGMSVALLTKAPYATYDHPTIENRKYWRGMALYGSVGFALIAAVVFIRGASVVAVRDLLLLAVGWPSGLWVGLILGNRIKMWSAAMAQVFRFLHRLGRPMVAFGLGYLAIVLVFASVYGALWRLDGARTFSGLPGQPNFGDFAYFSLITAATVGYGDVAPRSTAARLSAGVEIIVSLGWTIVVFAALMSIFAPTSSADNKSPPSPDGHDTTNATAAS